MANKKMNFEAAMKRLDEIVKDLEKGDVTLEESLKLFEEGTVLVGFCNKTLDEAEQKILKLVGDKEEKADIGGIADETGGNGK